MLIDYNVCANIYTISQPNPIHKPAGCRREIYRPPVGERQATAGIHCHPAAIARTPGGHCRESGQSPPGHRRDIGRKFGHLRIKSAGGRTVSRRRSSGDHWVSLRLCSRSRKLAGDQRISKNSNPAKIRQKLVGHFRIRNPVVLGRPLKVHSVSVSALGYISGIESYLACCHQTCSKNEM